MTPKLGGEYAPVHPFHSIGHGFYTEDRGSARPGFSEFMATHLVQHRVMGDSKAMEVSKPDKKSVFLILHYLAHATNVERDRRHFQGKRIDQYGSKSFLARGVPQQVESGHRVVNFGHEAALMRPDRPEPYRSSFCSA